MKAGTWEIIGGIQTVQNDNEYIVIGFDPKSPTPYGTWLGYIENGKGNFMYGHYFNTKKEAFNDLNERVERFI